MKNKELIIDLSKRMGWEPQDVSEMLTALGSVVSEQLVNKNAVYLQGFGQFEVKKKAERITVNPVTGKRYLVPPKLAPVFRPGKTIKNKLKDLKDNG